MNKEMFESAVRHLDDSNAEFWIHMTLETGYTKEAIESEFNRILNEFLSAVSFASHSWLSTSSFSSYKSRFSTEMKYCGFPLFTVIKVFNRICPRFRLDYINTDFVHPYYYDVGFDVYF